MSVWAQSRKHTSNLLAGGAKDAMGDGESHLHSALLRIVKLGGSSTLAVLGSNSGSAGQLQWRSVLSEVLRGSGARR